MSDEITRVKAGLSVTINLKNYQNIKIEVGIEDFRRNGETMDQAMDRVYKFVESQLEKRIDETIEEVKNSIGG